MNLKIGQKIKLKINEALSIPATLVNILSGERLDVQIHEDWEVFKKDDIITVDADQIL
jgi:hypothetical protein